jgi:hypothetical protein
MCRLEVSELQTRLAEIQEEVCSPRAGFLQVAVRVQTCSMVNDASNLKVVLHFKKNHTLQETYQTLDTLVCSLWSCMSVYLEPLVRSKSLLISPGGCEHIF